jgi:hypothetical protein
MTEDNIDSNADIKMDVDDDGNDEDVVAELREFSLRRFHSHIESTDDEMLRQLDWYALSLSFLDNNNPH